MTLPNSIGRRTVTFTAYKGDGTFEEGVVTITRSTQLQSVVDDAFVTPYSYIIPVASDTGYFAIDLEVNDSDDWLPTGWPYLIYFNFSTWKKLFAFLLPTDDGSAIDLSEVTPIDPVPDTPSSYVLLSMVGQHGGPAGPLDSFGLIPSEQIPGGGGGGGSGTVTQVSGVNPDGSGHVNLDPVYQKIDSDLTAFAALTPANGDTILRVAGAWLNRSMTQLKAALTLSKSDVGLDQVDDTSDVNKPISTAQATVNTAQAGINTAQATTNTAQTGINTAQATANGTFAVAATVTTALASKADLIGGKVDPAQIPDIAIVQYIGTSANQAAMLALSGQQGDFTIRTDLGTVWWITGSNPTQLSNWTQAAYPTAPVISVASKTGAVTLVKGDVGLGSVDNTSDAGKPISTAQAAVNTAQTTANGTFAVAATVNTALGAKADLVAGTVPSSQLPTAPVVSVATKTGAVTLVKGDVGLGSVDNTSDASKPISTAQAAVNTAQTSSNATFAVAATVTTALAAKADLIGGKVDPTQIPDLAIVQYVGTSANQAAMLAKTGQQGDFTIRTDLGTVWWITGSDPTQLSNWTQASYPTAPVTSVSTRTGAITLTKSDVGLGNVDNTADSSKAFAASQIVSGTLAYSLHPVGTAINTLAAGDDSRITGAQSASGLSTSVDGLYAAPAVMASYNTASPSGTGQTGFSAVTGNVPKAQNGPGKRTTLDGHIQCPYNTSGTVNVAANTIMCTLPTGSWPVQDTSILTRTLGSATQTIIDIFAADGTIRNHSTFASQVSPGDVISLDGMSFRHA